MIDIIAVAIGIAALVILVPLVLGCAQCFHRFLGFKDETRYSQDIESGLGSSQSIPGLDGTLHPPAESLDTDSIKGITFDPLPDIVGHHDGHSGADPALRPRVSTIVASENIRQAGSRYEIPRGQLFYVTEVGSGWFGQVLQGDAEKLRFGQTRTKVIVKVLKDDATAREQLQFLEEVLVFRELDHPNVLRFLGQCTETIPYLTILEHAANGDLKEYLLNNRENQEDFLERGSLLKFACDMSAGLACMHRHDFIHRDFAARNCVVTNEMCVKVGDYGISEDVYKDDYMLVGEDMIPIRWMSPESVTVQNGTVKVNEITRQANIWSFGVALWELFMLGERPYNYMTNQSVISQVIVDKFQQLPEPTTPVSWKSKAYDVMKYCWRDDRPDIAEVHKALQHLQGAVNDTFTAEFDAKWKLLVDQKAQASTRLTTAHIEKEVVVNGSGPPTGQNELVVKAEVLMEEEIAGSPHPRALQELTTGSPSTDLIENWTPSKKVGGDEFQMTSTPVNKSETTASLVTAPSTASTATDVFVTAVENSSSATSDLDEKEKEDNLKNEEFGKNEEKADSEPVNGQAEDPARGDNPVQTPALIEIQAAVDSNDVPLISGLDDNTQVLSRPDIIEDLESKDVVPTPEVQVSGSVDQPQSGTAVTVDDHVERAAAGEGSLLTTPALGEGQEVAQAKVSDSGFATGESFSLDLLVSGKHSDFSSSRKPLDFVEDVSYRRRSLLARDHSGMLPTIPEDRVPSISDGSVTDLNFDSFDDSSVIQDSFEWDEDIGRQLVGMVQETNWDYSPRYGLELSDWSLDQSESSQLKKSKRDSGSSSFGTNHQHHAIASSVLISDDSDEEGLPDDGTEDSTPGNISSSIQPQTAS